MVAGDTTKFSGRGFVWESVLQGGGVKFFIQVIERSGIGLIIFSFIVDSWVPFALFALILILIVGFSFYLARTPEGRLFFLDSNSFIRAMRMQMELMGDSSGFKRIGPKTEFVQPVSVENSQSTKANIGDGK